MDPASKPNAETSQLEQGLLEAARNDRIPDALRARMAEGLGLQIAGTALQGSLATSSKLGTPLFAKAGLWGVLSATLLAAVTAWQVARPARHEGAAAAAAGANAPQAVEPAPAPPTAAATPDTELAVPSASATSASSSVAAPGRPAVDDSALRAEIALLDRARYALRDGASDRALRLLKQHRRRFAAGKLAPEAGALRIEALLQQGSYAEAESMSREFASAYPSHPLRERVAALHARARQSSSPSD